MVFIKNFTIKTQDCEGMSSQVTDRVLMIRPSAFYANPETSKDNVFQDGAASTLAKEKSLESAREEFDSLVDELKIVGVDVTVVDGGTETPDAVFPNNWIVFLDGTDKMPPAIALFPMLSPLRRKERRNDIVRTWEKTLGGVVKDYSRYEENGQYLEGTGSMVLDRVNHIVYAGISQRTNLSLLEEFCKDFDYRLLSFHAYTVSSKGERSPIYHTNVMLQISSTFAVVCLESILNEEERETVKLQLEKCGKEIVVVNADQMANYACNCLQLSGNGGHYLVMSSRAYNAFSQDQLAQFSRHHCRLLHSDLQMIECCGGGSARCMITEIFPLNSQEH